MATLKILRARAQIPQEQLVGSWPGAFGQTQFNSPSTYQRIANRLSIGDGRRDNRRIDPWDALGSTGRIYLAPIENWRAVGALGLTRCASPFGFSAGEPHGGAPTASARCPTSPPGGVRKVDGHSALTFGPWPKAPRSSPRRA